MNNNDRRDDELASSADFDARFADMAPALFAWAELRIRPSMRARLEPQDLLQEVWLRGRKGFERFEERGVSFRAWAFKIGKNILMEAIRAMRVEPNAHAGSSASVLALEGIPQSITSFTQHLAREDSVRAFLAHAAELDESDRMLLIHCGLEDETCAEAALKLGLGEDAAIKRWQRLKGKLRGCAWARQFVELDSTPETDPNART